MADSPEEIKKKQKLYLFIGGLLFVGTVLTVAVATIPALDFGAHGFDAADMWLGLAIASVKATLVMVIFMHLNHEKKLIYLFYGMAIFMAIACMGLIGWAKDDPITYGNPKLSDGFYDPSKEATKEHDAFKEH